MLRAIGLVLVSILIFTKADLVPWRTTDCPAVTESCRPDFGDEDRCAYLCDQNECNLRIGIILPNNTNYIVNAVQALNELQTVEEHARRISLLPDRLNVTYKIFDDNCEQAHATIGTVDAYSQFCAHVIFGPICDYCLASAARIVKFLGSHGTPLITAGGFSFDFVSNKTSCDKEFFMLVNSGIADYQSFSEFFYLILEKYKWKQIALMYEKYDQNEVGGDQSCQLLMKAVIGTAKHQIPDVNYHDGDISLQKITYQEYLTKTVGTQYGIIVMCMSHANSRRVLIEAEKLGMTDRGEYVFINFDMYNNGSQPWYDANDDEINNQLAKKAFRSLLTITPMIEALIEDPYEDINIKDNFKQPGSAYLDGIYDGFMLYLSAISGYLQREDWTNLTMKGVDVVSNMFGKRFTGKRGDEILMNCNGQRVANYALLQPQGDENKLQLVANYSTLDKRIHFLQDIHWVGGQPPNDTPECGYDKSKCSVNVLLWISICIVPVFITLFFFGYRMYNKYMIELDLAADNWKISKEELILPSLPRASVRVQDPPLAFSNEFVQQQAKCTIVQYNMNDVVIKEFKPLAKIEVDRCKRMELKKMKDLSHSSLAKFYGACLDPDYTCIVMEYCQRGSLMDVLKDDGMKLDAVTLPLINDIVLGMHYLHSNNITHESLKSTNCLIDGHFAVKISDFGLRFIRKHWEDHGDEEEQCKKQIWSAPEILRKNPRTMETVKKSDVYSFGIILHEILVRKGPFYVKDETITAKQIIDRVKKGPETEKDSPLRPHVEVNRQDTHKLTDLMKECWAEDSDERPDFARLKTMIRELNRNNQGNLVDNLLNRMEVYANNLEALVMDRTNDFLSEKKKCENLLYQLLPKSVASQLISEQAVIAETFDQVTICFTDIVEFTKLSALSTPLEVVEMLNDLYTCFDEVIGDFNVYKVETIGDAYLVVSGLPERNGKRHASEIARMSLKLMETVRTFKIRHRPNEQLKLRIGMHTGSCVAGVVGLKMPRYCLFGDTVNTASRMESNGLPEKIHVSADTRCVLDASLPPSFELECRGEIDIKGKGKMTTYWLLREVQPQSKNVPQPARTTASISCANSTTPQKSTKAKTSNQSKHHQQPTRPSASTIGASTSLPTANGKTNEARRKDGEEAIPLLRRV